MREQPFTTSDLKLELERRLGFVLRSLVRLDGASSLNFKAVRATDGLAFAVKCSAIGREVWFDLHAAHILELRGSLAVQPLWVLECAEPFAGCKIMCMSWCAGARVFPDRLSDEQYLWFLEDFLSFSKDLQRVTEVKPLQPLVDWLRDAKTRKGSGAWLLRWVLRDIDENALMFREAFVRNIHGDFHHGNFLFKDGRVAGVMDFEEIRQGYPTEDLLRYLVCAKEHLRWYEIGRVRHLRQCFRTALMRLPYARHEWELGVSSRYLTKVHVKLRNRTRVGLGVALNLWFRWRFYRALLTDVVDYVRQAN